ncbi:MAG: response regulator [Chitinophagaceae bacterium]|nr:response regulator [Anaerolineae bacterium]
MNTSDWKVVVVEDTYDDVQMVSKILGHYGIQVHITRNGNECIQLLQKFEPTLVLTDLAMPDKDGWETLVAIRSNPKTAHIPVIALTAYHSADVADDAIRAGFDGYFAKPINPTTFIQQLEILIA